MFNKILFSACSTIKVLFELVVHLNILINYLISKFFQKLSFHVLLKTSNSKTLRAATPPPITLNRRFQRNFMMRLEI